MRKLFGKYKLLLFTAAMGFTACVRTSRECVEFATLQDSCVMRCSYNQEINCFDARYNLEMPVRSDNEAVSVVRQTLITDLFGEQYTALDNRTLLSRYIADCVDEYNRVSTDLSEFVASNIYTEHVEAVPLFQNDQLLTYEATRYMFTGGAHGMSTTTCWVFDLETGNQLTEDDLFVVNASDALSALLRQALTIDAGKRNIALDEFFDDQVLPNGNFAITEDGMYYQFNVYDIAPYCYGDTRLLLTKDQLKPLMRKNTPVYALWFDK
ncbi:MAG: DUF3298 domain-containing protein [Paludibacteraceae bacterium]